MYRTVIRPAVEYSSIVYHMLISRELAGKLESVQRQALRIIFGYSADIQDIMERWDIELLEDRRRAAVLRFAVKNEKNPRYGGRWFKEARHEEREVRTTTRNKYIEPRCRTDRLKNNPINYMTKLLNEHYKSN